MPAPQSLLDLFVRGRPFVLPASNKQAITATDATIDFSADPVDELVIDNGTDAIITYVVTESGANTGKTFTINPGKIERFVGEGITNLAITIGGTGTVAFRGFN